MGVMNINVSEQLIENPQGSGKVGGILLSQNVCSSEWSISVKPGLDVFQTSAFVWVEYTILGGYGTVEKTNGNLVAAVNGEQINSYTTYTGILEGYIAQFDNQNLHFSEIRFILKDNYNGNIIDTRTFTRLNTGSQCAV
jgi:hypothetical protein